ncbi:MAG: hypothetical protein P8M32_09530 [Phycisphaerales bacterium]|nr:hypothetical protein [Phycisphaerales bacterium]
MLWLELTLSARNSVEAKSLGCCPDRANEPLPSPSDILVVLDTWGDCDAYSADVHGDGLVGVDDLFAAVRCWVVEVDPHPSQRVVNPGLVAVLL